MTSALLVLAGYSGVRIVRSAVKFVRYHMNAIYWVQARVSEVIGVSNTGGKSLF
jgi:hypothetical protein